MKNVMDTLRERGFIKQTVYEEELYEKLGTKVSFSLLYFNMIHPPNMQAP